jgi:2-polyprenyl-3-methyl-5-hydroxy-6-metoxy-1,4-benzoquinol methylase
LSGTSKTLDPANQVVLETRERHGIESFGLMSNQIWRDDPRRLVFTLARYKFVAKMFEGRRRVLEVGCGDGFGARIVQQAVGPEGRVTAIDVEPMFVADLKSRSQSAWPLEAAVHDMLERPFPERFDAIYLLDVLEHIEPGLEDRFLGNIVASLEDDGATIVGIPSLESQAYASLPSRQGHVNCKSGPDFRTVMLKHFRNVFLFSMNDEVVHTGFHKMAHYLLALCCSPKRG